MGGARRDSLCHRLHEPGARLRHQCAHPRVLRLGGAAHGRPGDPARHAPAGGEASVSLAGLLQGTVQGPARMTSVVRRAVDHYHELLSDELAGESQAALEAELRSRGLFFGERPLCTVLRPRFLAPEHYRFLRSRCAVLLRAFDRAHRAALASDVVRRQFGLTEWEEALVPEDPGFSDPSPTSRIDAFYFPEQGDLSVTEYNAETPAGTAYNDALSEVFLALPVMRQFLRRFDVRPIPARHGVLNAKLFSVVERRAIDAHVPWTRTVVEQKTLHGGRTVDLVPFILAQRDRLVLKPNDEYGGKGIVLGWEVDDVAWQRAVGAALAEPYVVQERVPIPSEQFPSLVDGRVTYADRILDTNPFACHGAYVEGCLSRLSTAALVNVTAGGGSQVPTFLVEAR